MADPRINPTNPNTSGRQAMNPNRQAAGRQPMAQSAPNPGQITHTVGRLSSYGVMRNGINQLREGDIIRGEISDLRNNEITITLENNTMIRGQISDSSNLSIGQTAAFRMSRISPDGLLIDAVQGSYTETELTLIRKALDEAGLPATDYNKTAVKALMDNLLPINKQSIQHLMQQAYDVGTKDMETLCLMNRQHLDITPDSVAQFSSYRTGQHQLLSRAQSFSEGLPQLLSALAENGPEQAVASFGQRLLAISLSASQPTELTETQQAGTSGPQDTTQFPTISALPEEELAQLRTMLSNTPLDDAGLRSLQTGTMSQSEAMILLYESAAEGTLLLPEGTNVQDTVALLQQIARTLQLPELSISPEKLMTAEDTAGHTDSAQTEEAAAPDSSSTGENAAAAVPAETQEDSHPAMSFAGKLFHNLSDAAKSSLQNLNQNINQMLSTGQETTQDFSHAPSALHLLQNTLNSQTREQDALFTYLPASERTQLSTSLNELGLPPDFTDKVARGEVSTREVFTALQSAMPSADPATLSQLFQSAAFQKLFSQSLLESLTITPRQLAKESGTDSFFHKMEAQMDAYEDLIQTTLSGDDSRQLSGQAHDMKQNIDFMKMLNESFGYMQLPLRLQNEKAHGDLYVYTKKDKLKENPDKISLLLHLEMDHLGTVDVHLKKERQNIDATFTLEHEASRKLLERNTHMLQNSLNEKGYTCNIQVQPLEKEETPVQSFLNAKVTTSSGKELKRFSFDIRA